MHAVHDIVLAIPFRLSVYLVNIYHFTALTLLVGRQEGHPDQTITNPA